MSQHEATQQEKYKAQSEEHKLQVEQLKAGALREQNQAELERRKHQHEMDMKKVQYQGRNTAIGTLLAADCSAPDDVTRIDGSGCFLYVPSPREATSVAMRIGIRPLRKRLRTWSRSF